jgi:hypothetical protein
MRAHSTLAIGAEAGGHLNLLATLANVSVERA